MKISTNRFHLVCHRVAVTIVVAIALLSSGCARKSNINMHKIVGRYQLFDSLYPHTLDTVQLDVYEDFTCPACQQFSNKLAPPLLAAFGTRIHVQTHYLVGYESPVSAQTLYMVASARGLGVPAAERLFAAKLDHHSEAKNGPIVVNIAKELKVQSDYEAALHDPKTVQEIRAAWDGDGAHITFLPSIVIEHVLLADSDPQNLAVIINSLLKEPLK